MSPAVIVLVMASCVLRAGWNLQVKRWSVSPAFFLRATGLVTLVTAPVAALVGAPAAMRHASLTLWLCLLITGVCMAGYYICLALAYRSGDVSVVYPLARISPLFVVPLAA